MSTREWPKSDAWKDTMSNVMANKKWMWRYHPVSGRHECRRINADDVAAFTKNGWMLGKIDPKKKVAVVVRRKKRGRPPVLCDACNKPLHG